MATIQFGWSRGENLDGPRYVTEGTGGGAPTDSVDVNIADGLSKEEAVIALDLIRDKIIQSVNFTV